MRGSKLNEPEIIDKSMKREMEECEQKEMMVKEVPERIESEWTGAEWVEKWICGLGFI